MLRRWRQSLLIIGLLVSGTTLTVRPSASASQADAIIALERTALDRWGRGDPGGYLELYARDITYFDPMRERRVDGLDLMRQLLEPIRGRVKVDHYEMIAPDVRLAGDAAILTYNLTSHGRRPDGGAVVTRWNSTAVYAQVEGRWRIVHSHWSFTTPELKAPTVP